MKTKRFQYKYRSNASRLHKKVGDWLRATYSGYEWYQEYPVKKINSTWPNHRAKYDWCCPSLKCVVECHGQQHTKEVQWHGRILTNISATSKSLKEIQEQDKLKKRAAEEVGFLYCVVHYNEDPAIVLPAQLARSHPKKTLPLDKKQESSYDIKRKERAREYRKEQYRRAKEWQKQLILQRTLDSKDQ